MRKAFLRSPVKFSRISSRFTTRRWHPILAKWRSHKGVDYAAPRGTPIRSSGDGKVTFRGTKGGYGKTVFIKHGSKYTTVYAHMSRFAKGIRNGKHVKQGQIIGYVGSTGLASGPHLHYEFRVNGVHRNPLTVKLPDAEPIDKAYQADFKQETKSYLAMLDLMKEETVAQADNQPEQ
jgi:murein DD-endopeptidase MepM/ murein hydrolase activator NlpD